MPIDPNNLAATATMTFDDEFNSLNLWNGTSGTWSTTYIFADPNGNGSSLPSNGEQEWYINNLDPATSSVTPWTVQNGVLHLTAAPAAANIQPLINNYQYTSGLLETSHSFSQTYGYFEMKAELPAGQGLWPAFWLLPQSGAWPPELDVLEMLGNDPSTIYTTVHSTTLPNNQSGLGSNVANTSTGYHTYGLDWEPDYLTWYFDGHAVYRVPTPSDLNQPMYMLLNLAVGGYWPGNADGTTQFPADMKIDYVRAYSANPGATSTSVSTAVAATGSGDTLTAAGTAAHLTGGGPTTSVAMLADGEIVTAGVQAGSGGANGVADLFTASGAATGGDIGLTGSAPGLDPQVTALAGGMFEIAYSGAGAPSGYQVYNAAGTRVFYVDAFSSGTPEFAALDDGGYVQANTNWNGRFAITAPNGVISWFNLPTASGGAALTPTAIQTLGDGGFVFSYAGSAELDRYSFNGGVHTTIKLASTPTGPAPAVAGFTDGVTEAAWLSTANGARALSVQGFDTYGAAKAGAITLASGVDATAEIKVLATGVHDQSVVLWSSGGSVRGAAFDGATASAPVTLAPGALDGVQEAVLTNGKLALSWLETDNGAQHLWAEVLDPTTMTATKQDLGVADGSAHLVALAGGGFAESWHAGSAIEAVVYDGLGHYGAQTAVAGDFVGVNSSGQVVAVGVDANGNATQQDYSLSGGSAPPSGATAGAATADFLGDLHSASVLQNTKGVVQIAELGASGQETYSSVAALGPEWKFVGVGDYLHLGQAQYLIENAAGAVETGAVVNGHTQFTTVAALGSEWSFAGSGDFLDDGRSGFLIENTQGVVEVGEVGTNGRASYTKVAALGHEWTFQAAGDFLGEGHSQFLIENTSGLLEVGDVVNGKTAYHAVAAVGSEWKFVGAGDFLGDGKWGFLMENAAGAVEVGEVGANGKASFTTVGGLGPEWKFVGAGDYLGEGHTQFLIENASGVVQLGDVINGHAHYTTVGGLGPEWSFHG
jgi:beta-glucanase (GH16 family)